MDDRPQPTPPTDAPNAGDPTGPLRLGDFIIEGVDRVFLTHQNITGMVNLPITIPVMLWDTYYHYRYGN